MANNENLPAHVATSMTEIGSITYASEVVAIIAGMAATEIDGVASMGTTASFADLLGRKQKPVTRGVKVEVGSEEASVDLVFSVEYGKPIQKVCRDVQESVRKSIETMTGLHVVKVDVHVLGVSFEKEAQLSQESAQAANVSLPSEPTRGTTIGQVVRSRPITPSASDADEDVDLPETTPNPWDQAIESANKVQFVAKEVGVVEADEDDDPVKEDIIAHVDDDETLDDDDEDDDDIESDIADDAIIVDETELPEDEDQHETPSTAALDETILADDTL